MKIKSWLLISYLIVMILPLLSAYFLFAWITDYHNDKKVEEYYDVYTEIQEMKQVLQNVELYHPESSKEEVEQLESERLKITLYTKDGLVLYHSSNHVSVDPILVRKDNLYQNLYHLEQGLRSFKYKEPVFVNNNVVGLFEITVAREELVSTITNRVWIVTAIFIISFIAIYVAIASIVHKRINKRLYGLMDEMSAFASGNTYVETKTGNDEIGELKKHFYAMRKQILAAQKEIEMEQKEKEYMIATISHDLKTPLTSIKAYAESLDVSKNMSKKEFESYRTVIIEKADFIKQMLDDLITHTLLQSPDYELELVEVDGEEFFEMIISGYEQLCEQNNVQLIACNDVTGKHLVSPKQLMRVADNLMMNAIRHTYKRGKIWLVTLSEETQLDWLFDFVRRSFPFDFDRFTYLIVQNEGEGITEENMPYLFEPLYQVDQARSKKDAHGTGLGLSITKKIIEKHGGNVVVFSKLHVGACFICSIPKRREN